MAGPGRTLWLVYEGDGNQPVELTEAEHRWLARMVVIFFLLSIAARVLAEHVNQWVAVGVGFAVGMLAFASFTAFVARRRKQGPVALMRQVSRQGPTLGEELAESWRSKRWWLLAWAAICLVSIAVD